MSAQQTPPPQRILVVRLSALGDIVMASGLIPALHTLYPNAEVSWVCEAGCAPLLKHNPRIKQVIVGIQRVQSRDQARGHDDVPQR
jgi:ADP-heptose:LPS heptosyltransferase